MSDVYIGMIPHPSNWVDAENNVIIIGVDLKNHLRESTFIIKYDSNTGDLKWKLNHGHIHEDVICDSSSNVIIAGDDIRKYDPSGNLIWIGIRNRVINNPLLQFLQKFIDHFPLLARLLPVFTRLVNLQ